MEFPLVIVGRARSGIAAAKLLTKTGKSHGKDFFFYDDDPKKSDFKNFDFLKNLQPKSLILSPGYPLATEWLEKFQIQGHKIYSDLDFASTFLDSECVIGVTGSVGKSTLIKKIELVLKDAEESVHLCGNYGIPICDYVSDYVLEGRPVKYLLIELSSYQLELTTIPLDFGIITSFHPNHLDRYKNLQHYYTAKWRISDLVKEKLWINGESAELWDWSRHHKAHQIATIHAGYDFDTKVIHDLCTELGISHDIATSLLHFQGLPHRFEIVPTAQCLFVNNSKATTLEGIFFSVIEAQKRIGKDKNLCLLIGGKDKGNDWQRLEKLKEDSHLEVIAFGEASKKIQSLLPWIPAKKTLKIALEDLKKAPLSFDAVILAPGGASQDEFQDFEARGDFFKTFVTQNFS